MYTLLSRNPAFMRSSHVFMINLLASSCLSEVVVNVVVVDDDGVEVVVIVVVVVVVVVDDVVVVLTEVASEFSLSGNFSFLANPHRSDPSRMSFS